MDEPLEANLRDGTRVLIRPIRPEDRDQLEEGFGKLSPQSRYMRFHSVVQRLSEAQIRYFTEVDHYDHVALVAIDLDTEGQPGMGVARYVRLRDEPEVAEAAVTVLDEYQGRGLGTMLVDLLAREAVGNGVRVFRSYVLAENEPMLGVFEEFAGVRQIDDTGVYKIDLDLPPDTRKLPATAVGRVFRKAAQHWLPNLDFHLPPIWFGRRDDEEEPEDAGDDSESHDRRRLWKERGDLRTWLDEMFNTR